MPYHILLVEDDPDIAKMVQLSLRYQGGNRVSVATNGRDGLAVAERERPDVILLDVSMPEMDGYEVCRRLKADPVTASIPVVFLSARAQQMEIERGRSMGAAGYLVKPFDPMTLPHQLEAIIGRNEKE